MHSIGGLVVKLAVASGRLLHHRELHLIRPAPGSIPGRCIALPCVGLSFFVNFLLLVLEDVGRVVGVGGWAL